MRENKYFLDIFLLFIFFDAAYFPNFSYKHLMIITFRVALLNNFFINKILTFYLIMVQLTAFNNQLSFVNSRGVNFFTFYRSQAAFLYFIKFSADLVPQKLRTSFFSSGSAHSVKVSYSSINCRV